VPSPRFVRVKYRRLFIFAIFAVHFGFILPFFFFYSYFTRSPPKKTSECGGVVKKLVCAEERGKRGRFSRKAPHMHREAELNQTQFGANRSLQAGSPSNIDIRKNFQ
jgi:hypothetical protein